MPMKKTAAPAPCTDCEGEGTVQTAVRIGRKSVPGQTAICLACLGTGAKP